MKRSIPYHLLLAGLYFAIALMGILHHELWLDEAQHWLLARDSSSLAELFRNTRHEGHPLLWSSLLFVIARFTVDPFGMQLVHVLIATTAAIVFLRKAPFNSIFKTLFVFGYFFVFEYSLISRNYMLGVLFLFMACATYRQKEKLPLLVLFLVLAANTHLIFAVPAMAFVGLLFWEQRYEQRYQKKAFHLSIAVFIVGLLPVAAQIISTDAAWFFEPQKHIPIAEKCTKGLISVFNGVLVLPDFRSIHFWNTHFLIAVSKPFSAVLGLCCYALPLLLLRSRKILFFAYLAFFGIQLFFFITQRSGARFDGITYLILIMALWLDHDSESTQKVSKTYAKPVIYGILTLQLASGIIAYAIDWNHPFTGGKAAVAYLRSYRLDRLPVVSPTCDGTIISAYLGKKVWFLCPQSQQSFCPWDSACGQEMSQQLVLAQLNDYLQTHADFIYISNYKLSPTPVDGMNIQFIENFKKNILNNTDYYIFRISKS
ncbi:hypothetical protein [Flavobacterium sp.]|uniref:hypothetical protein n=1 Tax=Flavobacterium sp. TaxID=239 RepID=UPI0039E23379